MQTGQRPPGDWTGFSEPHFGQILGTAIVDPSRWENVLGVLILL
jgi:hypothetical protein